ncbi:MAG: UpxY family transcription antiterminator [Imperialibacter sp.]|uniref:UpxY family transcription antiterminator n=1 Tax=Imperialibacter sp. TaxID=2038411 RepID=UPI0032ED30D9
MPATTHWYVLYTRSRAEKKAAETLKKHGFRSYCPTVTSIRQWSDRKRKVQEPLFRSYVFVSATVEELVPILQTPGVINFVYWQGKPAIVRQNEIEAIGIFTQELAAKNVSELSFDFQEGSTVKIDWGAFKGMEGECIARQGNKIILHIESLGQVIRAEVPAVHLQQAR